MFGQSSKPSINWCYGVHGNIVNLELINAQILAAHRYRNQLVELERTRREKIAECLRSICPDVTMAEQAYAQAATQVEEIQSALRQKNQVARRRVASATDKATLAAARETRKMALLNLKGIKTLSYAKTEVVTALENLEGDFRERAKVLRKESGLYWGNYLTIEQSMQGSRTGAPPEFHRFRGEGSVAVQIQKGMETLDALLCQDSRLRIRLLPQSNPKEREQKAEVFLRIGSEGKTPIFATIPIVLHRHLPDDARVKWAYLHKTKIGTHFKYMVRLCLSRDSGWKKTDCATTGIVAINPGWRRTEQGLRVLMCVDDQGCVEEFTISEEKMQRWSKVDSLRSIRDRNFDAMRNRLVAWIAEHVCPDWMTERKVSTLSQWKSTARLASLCIHWRSNRFTGDGEVYEELEAWRKQDKHLCDWEDHQRKKNLGWRKDFYRKIAAKLRRRYHTVVIGKFSLPKMRRNPDVTADQGDDALKKYINIASVGMLTQFIKEVAADPVELSVEDITMTCHACGNRCEWDRVAEINHTCEHCECYWDQDVNACRNLLTRHTASGEVVDTCPETSRES